MLTEAFPHLENNIFFRLVRRYLRSTLHIALVAVLTLCSALLGWEVPAFYCYLALTLLTFFVGDDMTGAIPVFICGYMCISYPNNPQAFPNTSAILQPVNLLQLCYCAGVMVLLLVLRTLFSLIFNRNQETPRLGLSFMALAVAYLLGGALTPYYGFGSIAVGILEIAAIGALYFTVLYTLNWRRRDGEYIFRLLVIVGALVLLQIIAMYFREGTIVDGKLPHRGKLGTGWGHYNAVGCIMAMCAITPLYFAATKKHGWAYLLLSAVYMGGVALTFSRGSILFGSIAYVVAGVFTLIKSQKRERVYNLIAAGVLIVGLGVCALCFKEELKTFFEAMLKFGADDNGRKPLFQTAWRHFLSAPVFGVGWNGPPEDFMKPDMLPRFSAHNTYLQILGSLGIAGILAYAFHRFQTLVLVFRFPTAYKVFLAFVAFVIILICFMDCHFFQCGPSALVYSLVLAFMEGSDIKAGVDTRLWKRKKKTG